MELELWQQRTSCLRCSCCCVCFLWRRSLRCRRPWPRRTTTRPGSPRSWSRSTRARTAAPTRPLSLWLVGLGLRGAGQGAVNTHPRSAGRHRLTPAPAARQDDKSCTFTFAVVGGTNEEWWVAAVCSVWFCVDVAARLILSHGGAAGAASCRSGTSRLTRRRTVRTCAL